MPSRILTSLVSMYLQEERQEPNAEFKPKSPQTIERFDPQNVRSCPQEERQEPDAEFKPNLVNSVCFLVNWIIQVTTFAVNYVGHPFNTALLDNKGMAMCVR
jgi:hypothetical protein